jgi:GrpB-like predicted nucleotidyltransferase (UPF0157 family)
VTNLIEPYNPNWATEFKELKSCLLEKLFGLNIDVQHVGSTAIPNLPAKPILDIDLIIHDKSLLTKISKRLENIGYTNKGEQGITGRFAFRQTSEYIPVKGNNKEWQKHHLYVSYSDSLALKNHLLFREALLSDRKLVVQYATLKINLTKETGMTKEKYTNRKTDFIISILSKIGFDESELDEITNANT